MSKVTSTNALVTNELKLYDYKGVKASLTFGDANINDGYSYLRMNIKANDYKCSIYQDKPIFNIIAEEGITFNDHKIWNELNDGPNSGLNADLLDGLHAYDFKDRYGHHHFTHSFAPKGNKNFVKIATFTPRRVGNPPDFNVNGSIPQQGIFMQNALKRAEVKSKFEAFIDDTPDSLKQSGVNMFTHTDMYTEGVYNATLRASVSILKNGNGEGPTFDGPDTIDIHIGLFEDPTNTDNDGWTCTSKYFYVSLHGRSIPFLKENDDPEHDYTIGGNVSLVPVRTSKVRKKYKRKSSTKILNEVKDINVEEFKDIYIDIHDLECNDNVKPSYGENGSHDYDSHGGTINFKINECPHNENFVEYNHLFFLSDIVTTNMTLITDTTKGYISHIHDRPPIDDSNYVTTPDPSKNDYVVEEFPRIIPPGFGYQKELDIFRLYHVDSHEDTIDGVTIITHQFDLYMATDSKTEIKVQPYMSSSCLLYNYQEPLLESNLPERNFLRPKSIYDDRYSHVEHRHANYEDKIERIDIEIGEIWSMFDNYVVIDQGVDNKNKVLFTNEEGKVVCIDDNLERHKDDRRQGLRVLISDNDKCIAESSITTLELAQLTGVSGNIQLQLNQIATVTNHVIDNVDTILTLIEEISLTTQQTVGYMDIFASEIDFLERQVESLWLQFEDTYREFDDLWGNVDSIWQHIGKAWYQIDRIWNELIKNCVQRKGDSMWGDLMLLPKDCSHTDGTPDDNGQHEGSGIHILNGDADNINNYEHLKIFVRQNNNPYANNHGEYYIGMCEMGEFEDVLGGGKYKYHRPIWTYEYDHGRTERGTAASKYFHIWKESFLMKLAKISVRGDVPVGTPVIGDVWIRNGISNDELKQQTIEKGLISGDTGGDGVG